MVDSFNSSRRGTRETNARSSFLIWDGYYLHRNASVCLCHKLCVRVCLGGGGGLPHPQSPSSTLFPS